VCVCVCVCPVFAQALFFANHCNCTIPQKRPIFSWKGPVHTWANHFRKRTILQHVSAKEACIPTNKPCISAKRPVFPQKSPVFEPFLLNIFPQKRLIFPQKSPISLSHFSSPCRAVNNNKMEQFVKRAPHFRKRGLYSRKRALYLWVISPLPVVLSTTTKWSNLSKEPHISAKEAYIPAKEPYIFESFLLSLSCCQQQQNGAICQKSPTFPQKRLVFPQKSPTPLSHSSSSCRAVNNSKLEQFHKRAPQKSPAQKPYIPANEPYIPAKKPYISANKVYIHAKEPYSRDSKTEEQCLKSRALLQECRFHLCEYTALSTHWSTFLTLEIFLLCLRQERGSISQKSPIFPQMNPTFPQKSPTLETLLLCLRQERGSMSQKSPICP